jgi:hypothetical protein
LTASYTSAMRRAEGFHQIEQRNLALPVSCNSFNR